MTGRRTSATCAPEGTLELLMLDALQRYVDGGLFLPGDLIFPGLLTRLDWGDGAE